MKLTVSWINNNPKGRSIILTKGAKALPNGIRSIGGESGFVSVATPEQKLQFKIGDEVEIPDTAIVVQKEFINKENGNKTVIDTWKF